MTFWNDFVESSYSLISFEVYFKYLFGALSAWNAFFEFFCGYFASKNFISLHAV